MVLEPRFAQLFRNIVDSSPLSVQGLQTEREKTARLRVALEREGRAKHEWETFTEVSR